MTRSLPARRATWTTGSHASWEREKGSSNRAIGPPYPPSRGAPDSTTAAAGMTSAPQAGTPGGHAHAASAHTAAAKTALIAVTIAGNTHGSRIRQAASAHPRTPKTAPATAAPAGEYR
jgi:hypothetical protein